MNSSLQSRNVMVGGKRTSIRLEPEMWEGLFDIARNEKISVNAICSEVDRTRCQSSLTSAVRVFIVSYYRRHVTGTNFLRDSALFMPSSHASAAHLSQIKNDIALRKV
ncbi:MAG: ribbon-helix-helix domain-containing protein [Alphaproteobacteria bacterium]|nr:ribbon-helix-helix domain-containing protein [Alphaproteobacteria bacterium]